MNNQQSGCPGTKTSTIQSKKSKNHTIPISLFEMKCMHCHEVLGYGQQHPGRNSQELTLCRGVAHERLAKPSSFSWFIIICHVKLPQTGGAICTLHMTDDTLHYTLRTRHYTPHTARYTLHTTHYTAYQIECILHYIRRRVHTFHYIDIDSSSSNVWFSQTW